MKERIETLTSSFFDYSGKEHKFVIAAISEEFPITCGQTNGDLNDDRRLYYEVAEYVEDYGYEDCVCTVSKKVRLGISICNPGDTFNEEVGKKIAIHRARNGKIALLSTKNGYINGKVVNALLESESEFIQKNPGLYIKGYNDMEKSYIKREKMEDFIKDLTKSEKQIISKLEEDPKFIEDAIKYLKWKDGQN